MTDFAREFRFYETYETASWLEAAATDPASFYEMPWDIKTAREALGKYSKISILHYYIANLLAMEKRREYRKNLYDRMPEDIEEVRPVFAQYNIVLKDESNFNPFDDEYNEYEHFYLWFLYHEDSFENLWDEITEEVFHILFANRGFLLQFNRSLAEYLTGEPEIITPEQRDRSGKIKRAPYLPHWVKKAVYFRDQGRCVACLCDLTGLLSTDTRLHYDHIVPLNLFGVNDPCNMQLLCEACNLKKGGQEISTGNRYKTWW